MGKTLWQLWTEEKPKPVEYPFYDPLGVRPGGSITINELDYSDLHFNLQEIRECKRPKLGDQHTFTDYVLLARPIGGDDRTAIIRCFKLDNPRDDKPFRPVLLQPADSIAYEHELHAVVQDTTGKFVVNDDAGSPLAEYFRPDAGGKPLLGSFDLECRSIKEVIRPGVADNGPPGENKLKVEHYELWDYSRMTEQDGQPVEEYLYVQLEHRRVDGRLKPVWFTIWTGTELNPHNVVLM